MSPGLERMEQATHREQLEADVRRLVEKYLAMDESVGTCNRRLAEFGSAQTEASRRRYRELLVTAPGLSESISGAILFDETLHQNTRDGLPFADVLRSAGILVGIKVDAGASALAGQHGELVTEGLDGLRNRLQCYASLGARFAKWRAVLAIGVGMPSRVCIEVNAHALARYAALCPEAQIVPIVEPEVLMEGAHTLARCAEITAEVLHPVFEQLHRQGVALEAMLLKPNMVLPGLACAEPVSLDDVADATLPSECRAGRSGGRRIPLRWPGGRAVDGTLECHASAQYVGRSGLDARAPLPALAAHLLVRAPAARCGAAPVGRQR